MSGHSHAKTIKHQKELTDQKRGQVFSKMARMISVAVKAGGPDPGINSKLRLAIEMAKKFNMPKENVERAIKKGTGEVGETILEEVIFEAYGPGGTALIIEGITDNKNRTLGEIKQILSQNGGKLVAEGAIRWMFERKGALIVDYEQQNEDLKDREGLELKAIEAGAQDLYWHNNTLDIYTSVDDLERVKKNLEAQGIKVDSVSPDWVTKEMMPLEEKDKKTLDKLLEALDENDAVQEIYSNFKD